MNTPLRSDIWTFHGPGSMVFGRGALARVGESLDHLKAKRVLLIADPVLEKIGLVERVAGELTRARVDVQVSTAGEPEPSLQAVHACLAAAEVCRPDAVVGLGGGSNMDLAKAVALLLAHGGDIADYVGEDRVPGPVWPTLLIPTTAGTGSEVSGAAILTDTVHQTKVGVLSNFLRARVALIDPLLTVGCPPKVTADSGIDALTHAIEAYTAIDNPSFPAPPTGKTVYQGRTPFGDMLAEKAIRLIGAWLERAVHHPTDLEAREGMALAATMAGLAFSNVGVAVVHALEYPIGAQFHVSHGAGNGLLLPYCMRFNLPTRMHEFANIARWLGEDVEGMTPGDAAVKSVEAVERLRAAIGIPDRLRHVGVAMTHIPDLARRSFAIQRVLRVNPRPVSQPDLERILQEAL